MKYKETMKTFACLCGVCAALLLNASICLASPIVVNQPIGPKPAWPHQGPVQGYLAVYSATEEKQDGENTYFYPHSGYDIYTADGKHLQRVSNHISNRDEDPEKVELPAGTYKVKAWSENDGLMMMTVIIKGGQTTTLDLDSKNSGKSENLASNNAVKSPSGTVIGFKAK